MKEVRNEQHNNREREFTGPLLLLLLFSSLSREIKNVVNVSTRGGKQLSRGTCCTLRSRSFLSHSFRPALAPPHPTPFPNRFIRKYTSAKFQGTRVTREIRDRVVAVVSPALFCTKPPPLSPPRSHNIFQHSNGCASDTIRSRNFKCARGAWL